MIPFEACPTLLRLRRHAARTLGTDEACFNFANVNLYWAGSGSKLGAHKDQDHRAPVTAGPLTATVTLMAPGCDKLRDYVYKPDEPDETHPVVKISGLVSGSLRTSWVG